MALQAACSTLGVGRCLASLVQGCDGHAATILGRTSAAFAAQAIARGSEQASTSGRASAASGKGAGRPAAKGSAGAAGKPGKPGAAGQPSSSKSRDSKAASPKALKAAAAASHFAPCRLAQYARTVLHRELMLKLQPRAWDSVPRLVALEASITATETQLERDTVDKWELLLYSLALEVMTGRPARFVLPPGHKPSTTRATGVSVRLDARSDPDVAYGFLEKIVHVLLPSQMGFEGVAPPTPIPPHAKPGASGKAPPADHRAAPLRPFATEFVVANLLAFPDFERQFALYEQLRGVRVRVEMEGVRAEDCALLLSGLSVPLLTGPAAEAALAERAAEQARLQRA